MFRYLPVLIAVLLAIAVSQDAKSRGMNPWTWGVGTFFFTIIVGVIYLIVRKPKVM